MTDLRLVKGIRKHGKSVRLLRPYAEGIAELSKSYKLVKGWWVPLTPEAPQAEAPQAEAPQTTVPKGLFSRG